jgi:shikimate 5-dehydrogenase
VILNREFSYDIQGDMDSQLGDKRAVVTGSTAGIGFAIAKALASEGASVVVNGRTEQRVAEAIDKLRASGVRGKVDGLAGCWNGRRNTKTDGFGSRRGHPRKQCWDL